MLSSLCARGNRRAFSLQEVAVILVVLAILAAIAIPTYAWFIESTKRETAEVSAANYVKEVTAMAALAERDDPNSTLQTLPEAWVEGGQNLPAGSYIEGVPTPLPADATPTDLNGDDPGLPFLPITGGVITGEIEFGQGIEETYYPVLMTVIGDEVTFATEEGSTEPPFIPVPPDAPTGVAAARASDTSVSVSFTTPAFDGGTPITSYAAACTSSDGGAAGTDSGSSSPLTVAGLTTGKTYTCTVTATNAVGTSAASAASAPVQLIEVAGAPANLAVEPTVAGDDRLVFTWDPVEGTIAKPVAGYVLLQRNPATDLYEVAALIPGEASDTYTLTGLTAGTEYTFVIATTNPLGEGPRSLPVSETPIGVPAAATITDTDLGDGQISVDWTATSTAGAPIAGFRIYQDGVEVTTVNAAARTYTYTGLTPGTEYDLEVRSFNALGATAAATASDEVTVTAITTLDQVSWANPATTVTSTSVTLNWEALTSTTAKPVTGYAVYQLNTVTELYELVSLVPGASSDSYEVTGLTTGTVYSFQVVAYNVLGEGVRSAATTATPITLAAAATITDTAYGDEELTIEWTSESTASAPVVGYRLYRNGTEVTTVGAGATSYTFTGLTAGTQYTLAVKPYNSQGTTTAAGGSDTTTATAITTVNAVTWKAPASTVTDSSVTLNWNALTSTAAKPVTGYAVYQLNTATGLYALVSLVPGASSETYTVTGLETGVAYTFKVAGYNASGEGVRSEATTATTVGPPNTPSISSVTAASSTSLSVDWNLAVTDIKPVDSYLVECTSSDGGASGSATPAASPATVTSLTNGKTYTCTVTATNIAGSTSSAPSSSTLLAVAPGAPTSPTATLTSASSVNVAVTAPANNGGSAVTGYAATCTSSDGGTTRTGTSATTTIAVSSLSADKTYTCTATATNSAGTSVASSATTAFMAGEAAYSTYLAYLDAERLATEIQGSMN